MNCAIIVNEKCWSQIIFICCKSQSFTSVSHVHIVKIEFCDQHNMAIVYQIWARFFLVSEEYTPKCVVGCSISQLPYLLSLSLSLSFCKLVLYKLVSEICSNFVSIFLCLQYYAQLNSLLLHRTSEYIRWISCFDITFDRVLKEKLTIYSWGDCYPLQYWLVTLIAICKANVSWKRMYNIRRVRACRLSINDYPSCNKIWFPICYW
jgi:hypothetical protein